MLIRLALIIINISAFYNCYTIQLLMFADEYSRINAARIRDGPTGLGPSSNDAPWSQWARIAKQPLGVDFGGRIEFQSNCRI